jgi:hypothetical protein
MRSARIWLWIAAASLAAAPAGADNAKRRDGGSSSSQSSSDRERNHAAGTSATAGGGSSTSSSSSSSSSSSKSSDSTTSAPSRPRTQAEKDHPIPGTGTGDRRDHRGRHGGYHGGYGRGGGYWDGGIWVGGGCYDCYDPWYYPRYRYRHRHYDDSVGVRVQVKPEETRVYVDGYYAGVADDFDGILQRLYVSRGQHEIALRLEGFRSHRFVVYGVPGRTIKLHYNMVQGSGDDAAEDLAGQPAVSPRDRDDDDDEDDDDRVVYDSRGGFGKLSLDVRPDDASVYIDGKLYSEAGDDEVRLAVGVHRVEVVRPGYLSFEREVEIRPGKTADLDVHLEKK